MLKAPPSPALSSGSVRLAPVAIIGAGAVTALGYGAEAIWRGLADGMDGIRPIERFDTEGFSVRMAAMVPLDLAPDKTAQTAQKTTADHALDFALFAAKEAVFNAKIEGAGALPSRVALVFGTSLATHPEGIHRLAEITADAIGAHGPRLTFSTACSSSANAVGYGRDLLLANAADIVIAGGADALTDLIFAGFHNLGLLTPEKCAPFSEPFGTTLGEGAGFFVLLRGEDAVRLGSEPLGWISGYGLSCDAYHATSPDPSGAGVARASRAALDDAGLTPSDIDYINVHGTGTLANDPAEWRGIVTLLGERATSVPVSATKSVFGHGQGAAGVLEMLATLLAMRHGAIPQTLHHKGSRPRCPEDPVAQRAPRIHPVAHALSNSSAFGGANAIVAIDAFDKPAPERLVTPRPVSVIGAGIVLPGVADVAELRGVRPQRSLTGRIPKSAVPRAAANLDLRGESPLSRYLTFATASALKDSGVALRGGLRDRAGLFVALSRISPETAHELTDSVDERGLLRLSAPAFTRVVLNASTGVCARALSLRGPTTTLTTGDGGGLTALVLAAAHLSLKRDADLICVAAADEIDREESEDRLCEAGACLALAAGDMAEAARGPAVRISGWGLAGPKERGIAIERALSMAKMALNTAPTFKEGGPSIAAPASHPLLRAAVAVHRLRSPSASPSEPPHSAPALRALDNRSSAVLLAHDNASCSVAALLEVA